MSNVSVITLFTSVSFARNLIAFGGDFTENGVVYI